MLAAIWILTAALLGLWSLLAWGAWHIVTIDPLVLEDVDLWIERVPYPELLERWIPGWQVILRALVDGAVAVLNAIGEAAPVVVWSIWGCGAAVALLVAVLLTLLVRAFASEFGTPRAEAAR